MDFVEAIFNAAIRAGNDVQREAARRQELEHLRDNATRKCGGCFWWMKSRDCPREHNVAGQSKGPSCGASICTKYRPTDNQLEWERKYEEAMKETTA